MATNKHAIIRYRTIDRCLKDRNRSWTWHDLRDACEEALEESTGEAVQLSERTIKYDLAAMRSNEVLGYYAPIQYDRKEKSYYYTDLRYSLTETPITVQDKQDLNNAMQLLEQFVGTSQLSGLQTILTKLRNTINRQSGEMAKVIQFDHPIDARDQQWLYQLYQSIHVQQALQVVYQPFGKSKMTRLVSPYLLKEYKRRWYLISWDHTRADYRVYALDRIKSVSDALADYYLDPDFHPDQYFKDIVGVTVIKDKEVERVEFEVYGSQVDYFMTQPIHGSQKRLKKGKGSSIFEIWVSINYELVSELLSFGDQLVVLSPHSLQEQVQEVLKRQVKHYR